MTTRECMHLVTGSYFRSRKKDGSHVIRSALGENPMLHATFPAVCVIGDGKFNMCGKGYMQASIAWISVVYLFGPVTLILTL